MLSRKIEWTWNQSAAGSTPTRGIFYCSSQKVYSGCRAHSIASPRRVSTAWSMTGKKTSRHSLTALGLPGRFMINVLPRIPATARESIARSVTSRLRSRIASVIPGASRSHTSSVASGVTSLGANPVPPLVKTMSTFNLSA